MARLIVSGTPRGSSYDPGRISERVTAARSRPISAHRRSSRALRLMASSRLAPGTFQTSACSVTTRSVDEALTADRTTSVASDREQVVERPGVLDLRNGVRLLPHPWHVRVPDLLRRLADPEAGTCPSPASRAPAPAGVKGAVLHEASWHNRLAERCSGTLRSVLRFAREVDDAPARRSAPEARRVGAQAG